MKSRSSIVFVVAGIALLPAAASAQASAKPSYQSLQAKVKSQQAEIKSLEAQVNALRQAQRFAPLRSLTQGLIVNPSYQQQFNAFPQNNAPIDRTQPKPVPRPPMYYNIPDCRVIPLAQ